MKYSFLFVLLAFFLYPAFGQSRFGSFNNKEIKGRVKTAVRQYVTYREKADGELALVETLRYNEEGKMVEKSMDIPKAVHMSMKWIYTYNPAGQLVKSQVFHTHDNDGNERLLPEPPEYFQYNEYNAQGFVIKEITDGFNTHTEWTNTNDKNGNAIETISSEGRKLTYVYDDNDHLIEQRWHDGLTERVYQRQTSKYEDGRLVEKITYQGDVPETACTINYDNFDTAGNYTKETWYDHGKLTMTHEYAFTYY
ncbi:MAG: hypothetical protein K0R82_1410 [Flavipsychrobacter sp.]|nr:hypothetical protein [Flavipsychrobacter sp.]